MSFHKRGLATRLTAVVDTYSTIKTLLQVSSVHKLAYTHGKWKGCVLCYIVNQLMLKGEFLLLLENCYQVTFW